MIRPPPNNTDLPANFPSSFGEWWKPLSKALVADAEATKRLAKEVRLADSIDSKASPGTYAFKLMDQAMMLGTAPAVFYEAALAVLPESTHANLLASRKALIT